MYARYSNPGVVSPLRPHVPSPISREFHPSSGGQEFPKDRLPHFLRSGLAHYNISTLCLANVWHNRCREDPSPSHFKKLHAESSTIAMTCKRLRKMFSPVGSPVIALVLDVAPLCYPRSSPEMRPLDSPRPCSATPASIVFLLSLIFHLPLGRLEWNTYGGLRPYKLHQQCRM